ncbi:MAG: hypothetical protein ABJE10_20545 [bacterium]
MRFLRVLAIATGFAALLSQSSAAQDNRQFKDAWFWGLKGGALSYSSATTTNGGAPMLGVETLITRSYGGLYVAFDQAFLTTTGGFQDRDPDSSFTRFATLKNMRRFTMAGMAFPMQTRNLHPYFGGGLALNQIGGAALNSGTINSVRYQIALDSIQQKKASFSPIFIGGVQARYKPCSGFVQLTASPMQQSFFLANPNSSRSFNISLEFGVRYNVGSSIDKAR